MSSSSSLLSEEDLRCPICLDVFTDPITTPCGHNYCRTCITQCWDTVVVDDDDDEYMCPLCRTEFCHRPEVFVNNVLSEMALKFRRLRWEEECEKHEVEKKLWDIELRRIQKYAVDVTLDPDTAHPHLVLSEDGKQVKYQTYARIVSKDLPNNTEGFSHYPAVLGCPGFSSGRFYYEVQVKGTVWDLGVARESINRKGGIELAPINGYWTIGLRNGNRCCNIRYWARADIAAPLPIREEVQTVGVFVEYEEGLVSFFDVEARVHLYSYTGCSFTEKLYPFFSPGFIFNDGWTNIVPLIISAVIKADDLSEDSGNTMSPLTEKTPCSLRSII